jgi:hypothetical protein
MPLPTNLPEPPPLREGPPDLGPPTAPPAEPPREPMTKPMPDAGPVGPGTPHPSMPRKDS